VQVADDGAAGVAAFAAELGAFDAILMDCQMPVMDGYDAARAIRAMPDAGRRIPILAMTASAEAQERARCLAAGMDDFLLKPVVLGLLEETLDRWIQTPTDASPVTPVESPVSSAVASSGTSHAPPPVPAPVSCRPGSAGGAVVLDRSRLLELLASGAADLALLFRILDRFGSRADDVTTEMTGAVRAADCVGLGRLAHGLRGSAANVGLVRLAGLCQSIELAALEGQLPPAGALFEIEDEVAAGVVELDSFARDMVKDAAAAGGSLRRPAPVPSRG
jgi:CheY-like chemotaxis protein